MADDKQAQPVVEEKKKMPIKTIAIVAIIMVVEAGAFAAIQFFGGGPADVAAAQAKEDEMKALDQPTEVLVLEGRFNNNRTGRTIIYDTQAYVVVRKKYEMDIVDELATMQATMEEDMRTIVGRADPTHLGEPTLSTLKRQFRDALDARLKPDPETNKSRIEEVRIPRFIPIRAD